MFKIQAMNNEYHKSVLLDECIDALHIEADGIYVDLTFGGGGHSKAILSKLGPQGKLFGFDQDSDALRNQWADPRLTVIHSNFANARDYLLAIGVTSVQGVLADLGVSSYQLDHDGSGFSFRDGIDLDMRMNKDDMQTAADILNTYSLEELQRVFQDFGEVRNAKTLAQKIVEDRIVKKFQKSEDLNIILDSIKFGHFTAYAAPVYQALRMEVNRELKVLEDMLTSITEMISPNGRMAIITFHSLEDRMVKNFMKYGECIDEPTKDLFGRTKEWNWKNLTKKPIVPSQEEIKQNPRSRSAKLRIMEKQTNK
jgi:16S rRNA (cytosine1402-N4)-methyltransferase